MKRISLVMPVYNEQDILDDVIANYKGELKDVCKALGATLEIVAVNDGSTDTSREILMKHAKLDRHFRIVNFAERYGKQAAITAGMEATSGDVVILADTCLLNPAGVMTTMIEEYMHGANIVYAYRDCLPAEKRRRKMSKFLVNMATTMFGIDGEYTGKANLSLFSRAATDVLVALPAKNKYLRSMDNWVGFEIKKINYASNYNKPEIQAKVAQAKANKPTQGAPECKRDKAREHSSSTIYSLTALGMSVVFLAAWIVLAQFVTIPVPWFLAAIITFAVMITCAFLFFIRSVLIKRVGIVYRPEEAIYAVESVVN